MRIQIKLQQLKKNLGINQRNRKPQLTGKKDARVALYSNLANFWIVCGRSSSSFTRKSSSFRMTNASPFFQLQLKRQLLGGQRTRVQTSTNLLQHAVHQECHWLQQNQRMFQLNTFFEHQRFLYWNERA